MIQITRKAGVPIPTVLLEGGVELTTQMETAYQAGERLFNFDNTVYANGSVKAALIKIQNYKCCFCEAKIGHIDDGDVEHFRPKKAFRQSPETPLQRPGYYWLAYNWDNLFLACTKCNGRNKINLFPLLDGSARSTSHLTDIVNELPVFIHPANENPAAYITFEDNLPIGIDERGQITIECLGLDRPLLNEHRGERLDDLKVLYKMYALIPETPPELKAEALKNLRKQFELKTLEISEYAGMFRAFFENNPIDF